VIVAEDGRATLTDFGLVKAGEGTKLSTTGMVFGTPEYMSPEQAQGEKVDGRSDIYSLGIMLFEMLSGQVPFEADTPLEVSVKHLTAALPLPRAVNPDIPELVERVILKAMAKAPEDRYQRVSEMAEALKRAMEGGVKERVKEPLEIVEEEEEGPDLESLIEIVEDTE
jgi:serine/threonine protein kinase